MKAVVEVMRFQDRLCELTSAYNCVSKDACEFIMPTLVDNVVDLLTILTNDQSEWICYWIFDLDCGNRYKNGMVKDSEGTDVKLATIDDLWDLLSRENI